MCIHVQCSSFNLENLRDVMFIIIVAFYGNTDKPRFFVPTEMGNKSSKYRVFEIHCNRESVKFVTMNYF